MSMRVLLVVLALIVGYFAVYFGDGMHTIVTTTFSADAEFYSFLVVLLVLICAFLSCVAWWKGMRDFMDLGANDIQFAAIGAIAFVFAALVFGACAAPFTNYGAYPWEWTSRWDLVLVLGFVPTTVVIHGIIADIVTGHRDSA